ncbi:MAG: LysR family transcriptional regulator [Proteobacteria bacterium]|nr:LysR family transcriptional regulator [Pseudomonadota bacterium]
MADSLFEMRVFVRVVERGSLSAAARDLNLSLAVTSRTLARLEARLGVRLANRTTRRLSLTEEGQVFNQRCVAILADVEDAERDVARRRNEPAGLLRVTSTFAFGRRWLAGLLAEFQALYPQVQVRLETSDRLADLLEGGFDLAVRVGALADSSLIARQLAPNVRVICGSPDYLDRRGRPQAPDDLLGHQCILYGDPPSGHWTFADGAEVRVGGDLSCNDGDLAHTWALQGRGLALKSIWDVADDLAAGRLEVVLAKHRLPAAPIHAVYPTNRHLAARVRLCVDFLADRLKQQGAKLAMLRDGWGPAP